MCRSDRRCDVACCSQHCCVRESSGRHTQPAPPPECRPRLVQKIRSSMVFAAPAPAAAGRPAMQCRPSNVLHAGQACALPQRHWYPRRRCRSSAKPVRLHAHAQHEPSSSKQSGGSSSSRRPPHRVAATSAQVSVHAAGDAPELFSRPGLQHRHTCLDDTGPASSSVRYLPSITQSLHRWIPGPAGG
jgi:hypothetical protein